MSEYTVISEISAAKVPDHAELEKVRVLDAALADEPCGLVRIERGYTNTDAVCSPRWC